MLLLRRRSIVLLTACATLAFAGRSNAQLQPQPHLKVELISEQATAPPGQPLWVGLLFRLEQGWHIYWQNPGDSGEPPKIRWELPAGFVAGSIRWPQPIRLGEWIGCRLRLRRTGAVDGPHSGVANSQRDIASKPLRGSEIYRLPRRVHPGESPYHVVWSCGRRLGSLARTFRANTGAASKARARQLESDRSVGQATVHIVSASEAATTRREFSPARAGPDREFKPAGVCFESQWISPYAEEVGPINQADYRSERPHSPRAGPRLRGLGSRRFAIGESTWVNLEETIDDGWG